MEWPQILKIVKDYEAELDGWWTRKVTSKNIMKIQTLILLRLLTLNPIRNDYALLENKDTGKNNIYIPGRILIRDFKTARNHNAIEIKLPRKHSLMMRRWNRLKPHTETYLFVNAANRRMTRNNLSKLLIRFFNSRVQKNISTSILRHIYLSSKYGPSLRKRQLDAQQMGHTVSTAQDYIRLG